MSNYPDYEGFGYSFQRAELKLGTDIYVAIRNVSVDQPTTEGTIEGTQPFPLGRTEGVMGIGDGGVEFSDVAEMIRFFDQLGNGWRSKIWALSWLLTSPGKPNIKLACKGCRVLSNPFDHGTGEEALGGEITFSFLVHTVNGKVPHTGMPAPTR